MSSGSPRRGTSRQHKAANEARITAEVAKLLDRFHRNDSSQARNWVDAPAPGWGNARQREPRGLTRAERKAARELLVNPPIAPEDNAVIVLTRPDGTVRYVTVEIAGEHHDG
jgi:hypothetical protein